MDALRPFEPSDPSRERMLGLDGCRAVAAVAVVVYHVSGMVGRTIDPHPLGLDLDGWTAPLGNYGVCIFFLLSGFLLHRPFVAAQLAGRPAPNAARFLQRRFLRIYPAYWLALLAVLVFTASTGSSRPVGIGSTVAHVTLTQRFLSGGLDEGLQVAWTLCIEVSFYVALPAVAWCLVRLPGGRSPSPSVRVRSHVAGLVVLGTLAWGYRLVPRGAGEPLPVFAGLWLPNYLDWFALGMLLALAQAWRSSGGQLPAWVRGLADRPWLSWVLALQVYWVGVQLHVPVDLALQPQFHQYLARFAVNGCSAALFLLPCTLGTRRTAALRGLDNRVLTAAGAISYGIYLWHLPLMYLFRDLGLPLAFWPLLGATMATTVALASLSYVLVERPAMSWRRRPAVPVPSTRLVVT